MSDLMVTQSDLRLRATFFRSVTIVTSAAAIILAGSEGSLYPSALTPVFAIVGWILVDHYRWLRIPVLLGNVFGIIAFAAAANEFMGGTLERKLLSGSHLIVYLTWIVLILPKQNRQYWWLIALGVLQIAISGLLSGGVSFGAAMLGMMFLLLWTLSVFSLFRVQDRHTQSQSPQVVSSKKSLKSFLPSFLGLNGFLRRNSDSAAKSPADAKPTPSSQILIRNGLQRDSAETWVGWRFRGMVLGSYVISVVLALFVFAAFPRVWVPGSALFGDGADIQQRALRNRTGFTESVQLGEIGQIMESQQRVLVFDVTNLKTKKPMSVEAFADAMQMDEIRFRGNVLAYYADGQWSRGFAEKGYATGEDIRRFGEFTQLPSDFSLEIVQDPPANTFAFAPYPVSTVSATGNYRVVQTEVSGSLIWSGVGASETSANASRAFRVECPRMDGPSPPTFEFWSVPDGDSRRQRENYSQRRQEFANSIFIMDGFEGPMYRPVDGQMVLQPRRYNRKHDLQFSQPRLYKLANTLCKEDGKLVKAAECVQRILRYLSNENGFVYSLTSSRSNRSLDPVEDFLFNTKSGHCEYYASACTLMLQSVDVPARLINGYYGSEVNSLTGKNEVQQRHAHAWVEAFYEDRWQTVEPTPAAARQEDVASKRSSTLIGNLQTAISDLWNDGIHRMSAERQQQFFAPVITTSKSLLQTIREQGLWTTLKQSVISFVKSPEDWFSWRVGAVTFTVLLIAGLIARLKVLHLLKTCWRFLVSRFESRQRAGRSVIRFYEAFCSLCEKHGLPLPASNSAMENARLAVSEFQSRLATPELTSLPARIATAFNEVRFGNLNMSDDKAAEIGRDLTAFSDALKRREASTT
jgi:transglutaminase-like putative cysteine protease